MLFSEINKHSLQKVYSLFFQSIRCFTKENSIEIEKLYHGVIYVILFDMKKKDYFCVIQNTERTLISKIFLVVNHRDLVLLFLLIIFITFNSIQFISILLKEKKIRKLLENKLNVSSSKSSSKTYSTESDFTS